MLINPNSTRGIADVTGNRQSPAAVLFHATLMYVRENPLKPQAFQPLASNPMSLDRQVFEDTPRAY